jgi:hypothetical protein
LPLRVHSDSSGRDTVSTTRLARRGIAMPERLLVVLVATRSGMPVVVVPVPVLSRGACVVVRPTAMTDRRRRSQSRAGPRRSRSADSPCQNLLPASQRRPAAVRGLSEFDVRFRPTGRGVSSIVLQRRARHRFHASPSASLFGRLRAVQAARRLPAVSATGELPMVDRER